MFLKLSLIDDPRVKKLVAINLINEFEPLMKESREIFYHYMMNPERPLIK